MVESPYLTEQEAAAYLRFVKPSQLASMRRADKGPPYYRRGHRAVYDRNELDSWMRASRRSEPEAVSA